jgi:hypothetical protein
VSQQKRLIGSAYKADAAGTGAAEGND